MRIASVVAVSVLAAAPAYANLIIDGSFEAPGVTQNSFLRIAPGGEVSAGLPSWRVDTGDVDIVNQLFGLAAYDGSQYLDLHGFAAGALHQDFTTIPGTQYALFFAYHNNPVDGADPATAAVALTDVGSATSLLSFIISHARGTPWQTISQSFVATGLTTRLAFASTDPSSSGGIYLDGIDVVAREAPSTVPEPASVSLVAIGWTLLRLRRKVTNS